MMARHPSRTRATTAGIAVLVVAVAATSVAIATTSHPAAQGESPPSMAAADAPGATPEAAESVTPSPTALASPPSAAPGPSPTPAPGKTVAPDAPPSAGPTPAPSPVPEDAPPIFLDGFDPIVDIDRSSAEVLIGAALTVPNSAHARGVVDLERAFADIAAEAFQEEIEAEWLELRSAGWTISGERRVVDLTITELRKNTANVTACIDTSDVTLVDASGEPIGSDSARATRAQHIFTLEREKGVWRVTDRTFPNDPAC